MLNLKRSTERGTSSDPYRFYSTEILKVLGENCKAENLKVLDFGCGEQPFKKIIDSCGYIYHSYDIQQNSKSSVKFTLIDDIPTDFYDLVIFSDVLEHCYNQHAILEDVFSKLKKNGILIVTTPFLYREHEQPHDYWRMTSSCVEITFSKYGEVIHSYKIGNAADVARVSINEGIISKTFFARVIKFLTLRLLHYINRSSLYKFNENTFFGHIVCVKK